MNKWPCVFGEAYVRDEVYPRLWKDFKIKAFGPYIRMWRLEHCSRVNPYGSETCPYSTEQCGAAFLAAVNESRSAKTSKLGLFRAIATTSGARRADDKPLARVEYDRTHGHPEGTRGLRAGPGAGSPDALLGADPRSARGRDQDPAGVPGTGAVGLRGQGHRPVHRLGDLLRGDGAGPRTHPYRRHESQESPDDTGHRRDPVSSPSPRRLGDQSPSGDPDLHQGGE